MKRVVSIAVVIILILALSVTALSEEEIFAVGRHYLESLIDTSGRLATTSDVNFTFDYDIAFFLQEGNKSFSIRSDYRDYLYHPFIGNDYVPYSDDELYSAFFHLITLFDEIQNELPDGKSLSLSLYTSDGSYTVTADTIAQYYSWLTE